MKQCPFRLCVFPYIMSSSTLSQGNSGYRNTMYQKWERMKTIYTVFGLFLVAVVSNAETASSWKGNGKGFGGGCGKMQWVFWLYHWRLEVTTGVSAMLLLGCGFWVFAGMFNIVSLPELNWVSRTLSMGEAHFDETCPVVFLAHHM